MIRHVTHVAYVDDAGDTGYPQGTVLACLVALVFTRRDAVLARRRLRKLVWKWSHEFKFNRLPELHCPSWLRDYDHETGLNIADRHRMMQEFLRETRGIQARLVPIVLDKRKNQPARVDGRVGVIVWQHMFLEALRSHPFTIADRIEWCIDGLRTPHIGTAARKAKENSDAACDVHSSVCAAPPRYVDCRNEILIQLADAAVYLLYQAIFPAKDHIDLNLSFDVSALDHLCQTSVLADAVYIRLRRQKKNRPPSKRSDRSLVNLPGRTAPIGSNSIIRPQRPDYHARMPWP